MSFPIRSRRWPYYDHDTSIPGASYYTGLYDANPYQHGSQTGGGRADDDAGQQQRGGDQSRNGDRGPRHQKMTRAEASEILGLKEGATRDEINAAWRRVIAQVHRDKGGSDYLTRQVNEAREVLLGS
jgi:hypothetical protein